MRLALLTEPPPLLRVLGLALLLAVGASAAFAALPRLAEAHRSGCHRWHSCPSDSGSYVCGDLGYYTYCPGGDPNAPSTEPPATAPDGDSDGVPDASDTCPTTSAATANGCPADGDGDGVPDASDSCPTTSAATANGCPLPPPDRDKDGVPDVIDHCPDVAGAAAGGCPPDSDADGTPDALDLCPTQRDERGDGCPFGESIRARILRVIDGDTISVRIGKKKTRTVRLIGIDSPESVKPGTPVECGAKAAARHLKKLSFTGRKPRKGRGVTLTTDPTQDRTDRYGRLLAYAKVDSGKVLQAEQLRAGWATVYVYGGKFERLSEFATLAGAAYFAKRGVWGACGGNFHSR